MIHALLILAVACLFLAFAFVLGWWAALRQSISKDDAATVDLNVKCPACGHRSGKIQCIDTTKGKAIQHTCQVCGAQFYEPTVIVGKSWEALPAVEPK